MTDCRVNDDDDQEYRFGVKGSTYMMTNPRYTSYFRRITKHTIFQKCINVLRDQKLKNVR